MYSFEDAEIQITEIEILSKITEFQIFKRYVTNFIQIDKDFLSDLYIDKRPSCRIYINSNNRLMYKDFGSGLHCGCFAYIAYKFSCTYFEALNIVASDFKIKNLEIKINPKLLVSNDENILNQEVKLERFKPRIEIISQPWTSTDYNYWNQYKIPLELLNEYNVFSCKYVYLYKKDKVSIFEYSKYNPIYADRFTNDGEYSYKIYKPLNEDKKYKWLFSGGSKTDIEGYDQLPLFGDTLILAKSLKDCICYHILDLPAISLQGETNKLDNDLVYKLLKRFNRIIINYDLDSEGIKNTERLSREYGFNYFYIDEVKDLSDYIKIKGLESAKQMINIKLNG